MRRFFYKSKKAVLADSLLLNLHSSKHLCVAGLLSCSCVLVDDVLGNCCVDLLDSLGVESSSLILVACFNSSLVLLTSGLVGCLESLVLHGLGLGNENALLSGSDIRHGIYLLC